MSKCGRCDGEGRVRAETYGFQYVVCSTCDGTGDTARARADRLEAENVRLREAMGRAVADLTPDANDPDVTVNPWTVRRNLKAALEPTNGN